MIAEVHQVKFPSGATAAPPEGANNLADEAAKAPVSAASSRLWTPVRARAWSSTCGTTKLRTKPSTRRKELTTDAEGSGSQIDPAHLYEVTYNG